MGAIPLELQVAPTGRTDNDGTSGRPFASVGQARDAIRRLRECDGLPAGGIVVRVQAGLYELTNSFTLDARDSGAADRPIVYRAAPGATPRLVGGRVVKDFVPVEDPAVLARLPEV
ncbi:MAG: hypothetical protein HY343_05900, partial [Lentisphaerae bacterium]|nr:hypothetical protein [Lentisphaerota bacterium]